MHPKSPNWLEDIASAITDITAWTSSLTLADYEQNDLLRSAIERKFEIIGEALVRLERSDRTTVARISDYRQIIGFRNRIAHGYDDIDHWQVWEIITQLLPVLRAEVEELLDEEDQP